MLGDVAMSAKKFDAIIVGAGAFGAWTALELERAGMSVAVLDAYGAGNSRASSGGETRVIRAGYGAESFYTRWAVRSLKLWREFFESAGDADLFRKTGVLWLAREGDELVTQTHATLQAEGVKVEKLSREEIEKRYPHFNLGDIVWGLFEPEGGALLARRAARKVLEEAVRLGANYSRAAVVAPEGEGSLKSIRTLEGESYEAEKFVFACGPWLPKLFPELLGERIRVTRQEVFFFGTPLGDTRFAPPQTPVWVDFGDEIYGIPDIENRGFKIAPDRHGPTFDPDSDSRTPSSETLGEVRRQLARRFPDMNDAPLVESRVCQYENTSNGDFLIDRHADFRNVWLIGGGSGHGFKHGPALGEYAARLIIEDGETDPRFSLESKEKLRARTIF